MSDEDRKKLPHETLDKEESTEDVEAHVRQGREAGDEGGSDDDNDVEAHVKPGR